MMPWFFPMVPYQSFKAHGTHIQFFIQYQVSSNHHKFLMGLVHIFLAHESQKILNDHPPDCFVETENHFTEEWGTDPWRKIYWTRWVHGVNQWINPVGFFFMFEWGYNHIINHHQQYWYANNSSRKFTINLGYRNTSASFFLGLSLWHTQLALSGKIVT